MDSTALSGHPACPAGYFAGSPSTSFQDRWESLKNIIEHQYINEKLQLPDLAEYMKVNHSFDAGVHQYKYQFKKWRLRKNVPAAAKNHIGRCLRTRAEAGRDSTVIQYKGHDVAPHKIRRYLKDKRRQDSILNRSQPSMGVVGNAKLTFSKNIFVHWNMPYGAFKSSGSNRLPTSPYDATSSPSGDITVATPPSDAASPGTLTGRRRMNLEALNRAAAERAKLFLQGKYMELMKTMSTQDFQIMTEWLYQFWFFSFKSAKHWGHGPRYWTAAGLQFDEYKATRISNYNTPDPSSWIDGASPPPITSASANDPLPHSEPSQLCNWVIHVRDRVRHQRLPKLSSELYPHDKNTWQSWSSAWKEPPFQERIRDALDHNDFSTLTSDTLPVAIPRITKAVERSPDEMLNEALSFAIMGRNVGLVQDLLVTAKRQKIDVESCHPFHLAASYLDGSKTCCGVFNILFEYIGLSKTNSIDDLGHTITDKLMLSILRSHTRALPSVVDPTNHETRFPGDEVDICGRWDADSHCYRTLLSRGVPAAPPEWKHKFCHTSAQVICEIIPLAHLLIRYEGFEASGLFSRLCTACGLNLKISRLHTLVFTAFHLAESGFEDEDLFGILACALAMLESGADPRIRLPFPMEFSESNLPASNKMGSCIHVLLNPAELAQRLGSPDWPEKLVTGWKLLCWVLSHSKISWCPNPYRTFDMNNPDDRACCNNYGHWGYFRNDRTLATLWASVQTELLTYRRINVGDPWLSDNFNLARLLQGLQDKNEVCVGLFEKGLMKAPCRCGSFLATWACENDVSAIYFSNMGIGDRAAYLVDK